jgi:hypothetical protein
MSLPYNSLLKIEKALHRDQVAWRLCMKNGFESLCPAEILDSLMLVENGIWMRTELLAQTV